MPESERKKLLLRLVVSMKLYSQNIKKSYWHELCDTSSGTTKYFCQRRWSYEKNIPELAVCKEMVPKWYLVLARAVSPIQFMVIGRFCQTSSQDSTRLAYPKVSIGIMVVKDGKVLMGKRKSAHGAGSMLAGGAFWVYGVVRRVRSTRSPWRNWYWNKNVRFLRLMNLRKYPLNIILILPLLQIGNQGYQKLWSWIIVRVGVGMILIVFLNRFNGS